MISKFLMPLRTCTARKLAVESHKYYNIAATMKCSTCTLSHTCFQSLVQGFTLTQVSIIWVLITDFVMSSDPHYVGGEGDQPCYCVAHCGPTIHQVVFYQDKLSNGSGVTVEHSVEVVISSCGGRSGPGDCE